MTSSLKHRRIRPRWLILGLGNVGRRYKKTRHNFGFMAVEDFAGIRGAKLWKKRLRCSYLYLEREEIVCAKPSTMMNLSGIAAAFLLDKYRLPPERMIVFYDDLDLPFGKVRVRAKGSSGGHKGIESIISAVNTENFPRIRLGIGGKQEKDAVSYVLSEFDCEEQQHLSEVVRNAIEAADLIIQGKIESAMNIYN